MLQIKTISHKIKYIYMQRKMSRETLPKFFQCLFLDHETSGDFYYLLSALLIFQYFTMSMCHF